MRSDEGTKHGRYMLLLRLRGTKRAVHDQYAGLIAEPDDLRNGEYSGKNMARIARTKRGR